MKPFKTVLVLAAALSVSLLAGCGVEAMEESSLDTQKALAVAVEEGSSVDISDAAVADPVCSGSITCSNATTSISVLCQKSGTQCKATCPSNTRFTAGGCSWVAAEPEPVPEPTP